MLPANAANYSLDSFIEKSGFYQTNKGKLIPQICIQVSTWKGGGGELIGVNRIRRVL